MIQSNKMDLFQNPDLKKTPNWKITYQLLRNRITTIPPKHFKDCQPMLESMFKLIPSDGNFTDTKLGEILDKIYSKDNDYIKFKGGNSQPATHSYGPTASFTNTIQTDNRQTMGSNDEPVKVKHGHVEPYEFSKDTTTQSPTIKSLVTVNRNVWELIFGTQKAAIKQVIALIKK